MAIPPYISVRGVQPYDYQDIHEIDRATFISPISKDWFLYRMHNFRDYFYVASNIFTGRVVGFSTGFDSPPGVILYQKRGHWKYGFISRIAVHPIFMGLGLGSTLLRAIENRFFMEHRKGILVSTRLSNCGAQMFYSRHGYTRMKTFKGHDLYESGVDPADRHMVVMYKKLKYE